MPEGNIIALVLRPNRAEWTVLQRRKHNAEIVQQKSVELAWPETIEDHLGPEAALYLKSLLPPLKGALGIVVPADRVLMRVLDLPSVDPDELHGMAELQVDKFSPFPVEQMALAMEILHQAEDSSRVLVAAVQHSVIDRLGDFLTAAGLYPQSVDVDVLGWWTLIRDEGRIAGEGQEMILILDQGATHLVVARDGIPVMIRSLEAVVDLSSPGVVDDLAEELSYTLLTLESSWGPAATARLTVWASSLSARSLAETLAANLAAEVNVAALDSLPPLSEGHTRRLAAPESAGLNLAPATWRRGILAKRLQRRALGVTVTAFVVWGGLMAGLWFWAEDQKSRLASSQATITQMQAEVESVRELRNQIDWLQQYGDRSYSSLECLREIAELLPVGVDITSMTYNKASQVNLRGEADTDQPINDFIAMLELSPLFSSVRTEGISTSTRGGRNRSQFRITMMLPSSVTGVEQP